jgi:hypothetical protein
MNLQHSIITTLEHISTLNTKAAQSQLDHINSSAYPQASKEEQSLAQSLLPKLEALSHPQMSKRATNHISQLLQETPPVTSSHNILEMTSFYGKVTSSLHDMLHIIENERSEQADLLTKNEEELYQKLGTWGYAQSLIKRRFSNSASDTQAPTSHAAATPPAIPSAPNPEILKPRPSMKKMGGKNNGLFTNTLPEPTKNYEPLKSIIKPKTLEPTALEEFGHITQLDTNAKKLWAFAGASCSVGVILHGARNSYLALHPSKNQDTPKEHINITRLVVGVAEMGAGAVGLYRTLTGHFSLKPVRGKAEIMHQCDIGNISRG